MRHEIYFPDIEFNDISAVPATADKKRQTFLERGFKSKIKKNVLEKVRVNDSLMWDCVRILQAEDSMLDFLMVEFGVSIPRETVDLQFLRREELIPRDLKTRKQLLEDYGESVFSSVVGGYKRINDDYHLIKLGYYGDQYRVPYVDVIATLTHELGHALGPIIPDKRFAELRAYACQSLCGYGFERQSIVNPRSVHSISRDMLWQLIERDITEPAIIAHLTGVQFGNFGPNDYKDQGIS